MGLSESFTNFELRIYEFHFMYTMNICHDFFFNWKIEKQTVLDQYELFFSTAQSEKNSWTNWGKQIGEIPGTQICNEKPDNAK